MFYMAMKKAADKSKKAPYCFGLHVAKQITAAMLWLNHA
ncbi:hypothetical protein RV18_GL003361 [Enterococcus termitis]|nr:hypothetical protein RV18_GL003361 [Enterococcus termitis]